MSEARNTSILVVMDEELMIELMSEFTPDRNRLIFAVSAAEALELCATLRPALVIVNVALAAADLRSIATRARACGACILGLGAGAAAPPAEVDELADPARPTKVAAAARRLVKERRQTPRATLELPVEVEGVGTLTASRISRRSLFIPGELSMQPGQSVRVEITIDGERSSCEAQVVRRRSDQAGEAGVVLLLDEQEDTMTSFLDKLIRQNILLRYLAQPLQVLGGAPKLSIARKIVDYGRQLIDVSPTAEYPALPSFVVERSGAGGEQVASIDEQWSELAEQWNTASGGPADKVDRSLDGAWEQIADEWEAVVQELSAPGRKEPAD